jgi:hypothetical protein
MFQLTDIPYNRSLEQSSQTHAPQIILHKHLGDLSSHSAFIMRGLDKKKFKHTETNPLYIHLSVLPGAARQAARVASILPLTPLLMAVNKTEHHLKTSIP